MNPQPKQHSTTPLHPKNTASANGALMAAAHMPELVKYAVSQKTETAAMIRIHTNARSVVLQTLHTHLFTSKSTLPR